MGNHCQPDVNAHPLRFGQHKSIITTQLIHILHGRTHHVQYTGNYLAHSSAESPLQSSPHPTVFWTLSASAAKYISHRRHEGFSRAVNRYNAGIIYPPTMLTDKEALRQRPAIVTVCRDGRNRPHTVYRSLHYTRYHCTGISKPANSTALHHIHILLMYRVQCWADSGSWHSPHCTEEINYAAHTW